ncbi:Uncharacterised protein [Mycobacteroides abscessus subsp. abscessus]|nr:Uncharacterised protein [Mycobacteroides abscessus subsp. abscessus]
MVLPTPLGPITPTMPLRGSVNERSLMRVRPSKPLSRCSTSTTTLPSRGPVGIWISSKSSFRVFSASVTISSYRCRRALFLACRALAPERTHASSSCRRLCSLASLRPCTAIRSAFFSR